MTTLIHNRRLALLAASLVISPTTFATNGMLLEGMGPESTAMGGTSQAFDNGTAAMVNNPATLGFMKSGESRFDFAVGNLRPDVTAGAAGDSDGDSYLMPAMGYTTKAGYFAYGVGVFSQGGMGTEFGSDTMLGQMAGGKARSEVGVGAVLFPISYDLTSKLTVGGTLQYVWGGMDMIFGMPVGNTAAPQAGTFADFANPSSNILGSATGTLVQGLGMPGGAPSFMTPGDSAVFEFSNDDDFTGQTKGQGAGASIGLLYKASPRFTVGGSYRSKTAMSNFKGSGSMKIINLDGSAGAPLNFEAEYSGDYSIKDFQFPAVASIGMAYQATPSTLLAMDVSHIDWSSVMDNVNIVFKADSGAVADITMKQGWKDQTVVKLGVEHAISPRTKIRGGVNLAKNPVPDEYLNPLFPAIIENHITAGFSHQFNKRSEVSASVSHAPEVKQTNSNTGMESTHSQTSLQLMYSRSF